jgi:hypothetical protein
MANLQVWIARAEHALVVVLLVVAAVFAHLHYKDVAVAQAQKLAQQGLPPDQLAKYTIQQNQLLELTRNAQGKTVVKTQYVPDEGGVQIVVKKQQELETKYQELLAELHQSKSSATTTAIDAQISSISAKIAQNLPEVTVQDHGWTSRFGFGLVTSPGHSIHYWVNSGESLDLPISPVLDWKFAYVQRWSALAQANLFYPGLEITRHVDDLTPHWLHMTNTELGLSGGPGWTGGWGGGVVIRTNW